jgi:hypothetical protein
LQQVCRASPRAIARGNTTIGSVRRDLQPSHPTDRGPRLVGPPRSRRSPSSTPGESCVARNPARIRRHQCRG